MKRSNEKAWQRFVFSSTYFSDISHDSLNCYLWCVHSDPPPRKGPISDIASMDSGLDYYGHIMRICTLVIFIVS